MGFWKDLLFPRMEPVEWPRFGQPQPWVTRNPERVAPARMPTTRTTTPSAARRQPRRERISENPSGHLDWYSHDELQEACNKAYERGWHARGQDQRGSRDAHADLVACEIALSQLLRAVVQVRDGYVGFADVTMQIAAAEAALREPAISGSSKPLREW